MNRPVTIIRPNGHLHALGDCTIRVDGIHLGATVVAIVPVDGSLGMRCVVRGLV